MQLSLLEPAQAITKTIKNIPLSSLELSPFNPRSTRPDDHTDKLAGRIARQGFEVTRALWVYPSGDKFLVFAGGTRLKAAIIAKLAEVPCVVHEGLTEADIVRLAYQDNENDEYHAPVSIVDVWANYAALAWQGWTQKQIGDAVGTDQATVSRRLKYNLLDPLVKRFMEQDSISEGHLKEFDLIWNVPYLDGWLDKNTAMLELCQIAAKDKLTVRDTKKIVEQWKAFIDLATKSHDALPEQWQAQLISALATNKARSIKEVQRAIDGVNIAKAKADKDAADALKLEQESKQNEADKSARLAADAEHRAKIEAIKHGDTWLCGKHIVICGDAYSLIDNLQADALISDPPYGIDYQPDWNKWDGSKGDFKPIAGDDKPFNPLPFLNFPTVLLFGANYYSNQLPLGGWLCWDKRTKEELDAMFGAPFELAWYKSTATAKKSIMVRIQHGGVVNADSKNGNNDKRYHATQKPIVLMQEIIQQLTNTSDTILDPFAGSGTTLLACERLGRACIAVEIDPENVKIILNRWSAETGETPCQA